MIRGIHCAGILALTIGLLGGTRTTQAEEHLPIVILVGIDGLRWDHPALWAPPRLTKLARSGVTAERMNPVFPTLTFPNFYTLATGLYPENHGIISNRMYDPEQQKSFALGSPSVQESSWWQGEPIWVTAEKQGLRAACMFWPGSEAEIAGHRPWQWHPFDYNLSADDRVDTVLAWLALPPVERPRLITLYFQDVDSAGHRQGPESQEAAEALARVDKAIGRLVDGVDRLGLDHQVNYVIVSDHGMAEVSPDRVITLSELIDLKTVDVDFSGAVAGLRPRKDDGEKVYQTLKAQENHFRVFRREEVPERLHFRQNQRIPPIVMIADEGWTIMQKPGRMTLKGAHGYDPEAASMGGFFLANGPVFQTVKVLPAFSSIHVYQLLCTILGLKPAANDGDERLAKEALANPS